MKKILVVDDEQEMVNMVRSRLEGNQYEVITASKGKEGVGKAKDEKPDLIVMDVMMPDLNGGEAAKILKNDPETENIPIIFLTAMLTKDDSGESLGINVEEKLYTSFAKPYNTDEFLSKIEEVLGE